MMFSILVHMFSVFFMKAYRSPREFGWLSGMVLLGLAAAFGFSGYLLPMDELSYFATKVGLQIPAAIPWVGPFAANLLRKPFVIGRWMYSNGVRVPNAIKIDQQGYLVHSNWVWSGADSSYSRGEAILRGECGSCHTLNGYRRAGHAAPGPRLPQH